MPTKPKPKPMPKQAREVDQPLETQVCPAMSNTFVPILHQNTLKRTDDMHEYMDYIIRRLNRIEDMFKGQQRQIEQLNRANAKASIVNVLHELMHTNEEKTHKLLDDDNEFMTSEHEELLDDDNEFMPCSHEELLDADNEFMIC